MKKYIYLILFALLLLNNYTTLSQKINVDSLGLIPLPQNIKISEGVWSLPYEINITAITPEEISVADFIKKHLQQSGRSSVITNKPSDIQLLTDKSVTHPEGYKLSVDKTGVKILASTGAGLFYGIQTFIQLIPSNVKVVNIPFIIIEDHPLFKWRGSMLDVARHFFEVSFIKKYIDFLASYKLNTFHWHLTDDQGWRIEIKKYPRLTEVAAFRKETIIGAQQIIDPKNYKFDGTPYGGFYSQEEIKEIVAYAKARYITIVPEIEMPGHSVAVIAAYPELACKPGNYETFTKWGITEDIVCPTEPTFQFFENVLSEVAQLFPGKYVHIGGDEAPKKVWRESAEVPMIMKKNNIKDVQKVQGWFNSRIEKFLQSKGKKLVGWDEILEGGITPSSTVMSWRGDKGGIEAARHGNDVVMTPSTHLYFDYGQNPNPHNPLEPLMICCYLPLEKVYSYNPLSKELTPEQHKYILGVQANLWTEFITTPGKVEYMLFPRLLALSEIAWTSYEKKNYENFLLRVGKQFESLDFKDINYRIPEPIGLDSGSITKQDNKAIISLRTIVPGAQIRYTLDGHIPDETTKLYTKPIAVPLNSGIKVRAVTIGPDGRHSVPSELDIP